MSRIVLLIEHPENRRLLVEWLSVHHEVVVPGAPGGVEPTFDLCLVDGPSLERHGPWIDAVKQAVHPLFLPFLLVTSRRSASSVGSHARHRIDELIVSPVEKQELQARVETLLRARELSLANASLRHRLELELARAREVQAGLLPREPPRLRGFELAATCIPAREVSGDFFDWQSVDEAAVLSVGDVMGKGIPAALLAATARAVLHAVARQNAPAAALDLLQETLSDDLERTSSFVTLFHAHLDVAPHVVRYVDAGHGHALVRRANGSVERLARGGRPVGFPAVERYHESTVQLGDGDILCVYSDGLLEGNIHPPETLISDLDTSASAATIVDQLVECAPGRSVADDVTILVLKCCEPAEDSGAYARHYVGA
jgi:serine phosphatase RsbU (regulator of sigma subunit)